MICWKIRIFAYWTTPFNSDSERWECCDLLKNSYLCLLNNTVGSPLYFATNVVICWKIRIFAYWTTPHARGARYDTALWFAEKFVSLLIEQHLLMEHYKTYKVVICWKIRIFAYWTTPVYEIIYNVFRCDLLKNSYLCLLNNTTPSESPRTPSVVICWKIRIFAYWTTPDKEFYFILGGCDLLKNSYLCLLNNTYIIYKREKGLLWFAEKFVSLLIEQHQLQVILFADVGCDLLKNSYLCLLNNTSLRLLLRYWDVVICWKIRIFAYWTTPDDKIDIRLFCCDLLKNSYLCLLNNTAFAVSYLRCSVVICWKIRIFAYWTTPCGWRCWRG